MSTDDDAQYGVAGQKVDQFEIMSPLLRAMYTEFQELSKKKPQDILSKNKVRVVNRVLEPVLTILDDEPERPFLELLDDDDLPQNSDVVLMLGQALAAMNSFRRRYHDNNGWHVIEEDIDE